MFPTCSYEINAPAVAAEIIDGEAIILHLPRGHYFSSEGSGALIWAALERGMTPPEVADALANHFAIDTAKAEAAVLAFLDELLQLDLIRVCQAPRVTSAIIEPLPCGGEYLPPDIHVYTDMQDLLLLDPIHEVDATGWPVAPDRAVA